MSGPADLRIVAVPDFPLVEAGTDLVAELLACLHNGSLSLEDGDVVAFAQKVVSKSEGRVVDLSTVTPTSRALELSAVVQKDARLVELVLRESRRIVRTAKDVLIVEHRLGFIMANAGIDQSNVSGSSESALLLPRDPDLSAQKLREEIRTRTGRIVAVLVTDSFGRPWRVGTTGVAIGAAGIASTLDLRGMPDMFGRMLRVSVVGHADEIAAAASLVMGQSAERRPVVIVRGLAANPIHTPAQSLLRPPGEDLFK
jgi:coenzyme F420-0:L-glutamate ligase / coenzyme F420-1:gamma-L-glutamate ligase